MKGYKLTGRGKITALCLVLMAVILLASAFTHLSKASPSPTGQEPSPSLSHAELPSSAPTPASVHSEPPHSTPTPPASASPAPIPSPTASPAVKPTAKSTPTPAPPQLPAAKTSLYFAPGTADLLVPDPSLQDYLIDSYEGLTLVVEGFASDSEGAASAEQLALERSKAVSQILKDLGVQSYDLMSIGTYRNAQDDTETADLARVDIYFLSTGSK